MNRHSCMELHNIISSVGWSITTASTIDTIATSVNTGIDITVVTGATAFWFVTFHTIGTGSDVQGVYCVRKLCLSHFSFSPSARC